LFQSSGELLGEGRVYGGGLHTLEPRELANVPFPEGVRCCRAPAGRRTRRICFQKQLRDSSAGFISPRAPAAARRNRARTVNRRQRLSRRRHRPRVPQCAHPASPTRTDRLSSG